MTPEPIVDDITERARQIAERETKALLDRTSGSKSLFDRAVKSMPMGVASSFQAGDPYPVYLDRGAGSNVWDVDGNRYVDFHSGFGVNIVGHAHPKIVEAVERAARTGTHFAVTTETTVALAEEICRRFNLDQLRFVNSGTEATMDAVRVARAATGRDILLKIEGSYHGHHDSVLFSVVPEADVLGLRYAGGVHQEGQPDRGYYQTPPTSKGVPGYTAQGTLIVPFNDVESLRNALEDHGEAIAALIMEPVMMNIGIVIPEPGYLEAVRELCTKHGVVLIYDEVKSGATIAAGGAVERFGVQPDLVCLAKAIGGGTTIGAFGGRADVMDVISHGAAQQGTFNGNPLSCSAGLAALTQVMTPEAYVRLAGFGTTLAEGCREAIQRHGIPAHSVDLGAKGCVSYRPEPLRNYRDFLECNADLFAASWPWMVNRGIFMTPGDEEQWTISAQHSQEDLQTYIGAFREFCAELAG